MYPYNTFKLPFQLLGFYHKIYSVLMPYGYMRVCETMMKLATHSSLLKTDDVRLKRLPIAARSCDQWDLAAMADVRHLVLQCLRWYM